MNPKGRAEAITGAEAVTAENINAVLTGMQLAKGSYSESSALFTGLATGELFLIGAECLARQDKKQGALDALNALLMKRWKTGTFTPVTAGDADEALFKVLQERRKGPVMRGIRWSGLRQLNKDARLAVTIKGGGQPGM